MTVLPFSDFLELLRAKGFGVGLHEHLALGKLLSRWDSIDLDELRRAIAALVARREDEVVAILRLFDEVYPRVDVVQPSLTSRKKRKNPRGSTGWCSLPGPGASGWPRSCCSSCCRSASLTSITRTSIGRSLLP